MSKVNINMDTESGECSVSLDGTILKNVTDFHGYKYSTGEFSFSCSEVEKMDDGCWCRVEYMLSGMKEAEAAIRAGKAVASKIKGFIKVIGNSRLVHDISDFLQRR